MYVVLLRLKAIVIILLQTIATLRSQIKSLNTDVERCVCMRVVCNMSFFYCRNLELHKEEVDEMTRQKDKEISHMKLQHEMNEKV